MSKNTLVKIGATIALGFILNSNVAFADCCLCHPKSDPLVNLCITDPTNGCADVLTKNSTNKDLVDNVICENRKLNDATECTPVGKGSASAICQQGPIAAPSYKAATQNAQFSQIPGAPPTQGIEIPKLNYSSKLTINNGFIEIPYLAQFVTAVYKYMLGIGIIAAAIMIVFGGFKFLMAATVQGVKDGKEIIIDALTGLVVLIGAVTILQAINPATAVTQSLKIKNVLPENPNTQLDGSQMTSDIKTQDGGGVTVGDPNGPCPFTLTNPLIFPGKLPMVNGHAAAVFDDPRNVEFWQKAKEVINGATVADRIAQAGLLAAQCKVYLGHCGQTAGTMWALAGVGDGSCLDPKNKKICDYSTMPRTEKSFPLKYMVSLRDTRCDHQACGCYNQKAPCDTFIPDCVKDQSAAMKKANEFVAAGIQNNEIKDYPDSWLTQLKPGDLIQVYNGNQSCGGGHSTVFLGWDHPGVAKVITGQIGEVTSIGMECLSAKGCNGPPIMDRVMSPKS